MLLVIYLDSRSNRMMKIGSTGRYQMDMEDFNACITQKVVYRRHRKTSFRECPSVYSLPTLYLLDHTLCIMLLFCAEKERSELKRTFVFSSYDIFS